MAQKFSKAYFEIYAKKSLEYYYNSSWLNLFDVTQEKPDLQSEVLNIGIEVTSSSDEGERKMDSIFEKFIEGKIDYDSLKGKINLLGGFVSKEEKATLMSPTKGLYDFQNHIENLANIIKIKTIKKLPNYKKFSRNMLYIFTNQSLFTRYDIEKAFSKLKEELLNCNLQFDLYFINCLDKLFIVDSTKNSIDEITITDSMLKKLKSEALVESVQN